MIIIELTHIYDMYRAEIDYSQCEQLACMKVVFLSKFILKYIQKIRALNISRVCKKSNFFNQ